jgi:hypothetical protein
VSKYFCHEKGKTPLVGVVKEGGKGAPGVLKQVVTCPSNLVVDGALENEILLHLCSYKCHN